MNDQLDVGQVITGTFDTLKQNSQAVLVYLAIFTVLGASIEWTFSNVGSTVAGFELPNWALAVFGIGAGISGLAFAAIAIVGQYLLWESMLRGSTVLNAGAGRRFFAFFFQAILIGLGTGVGFLFLIVPGLLFAARWAAAPAFLIVERMGIIDAMSASWNMVKGNSRHVIIAYVLAAVVVIGLSGAIAGASLLGGFDTSGQQGLGTMIGLHLVQQLATVLTVGLGVFLFHRLQGASQQLTEVFD